MSLEDLINSGTVTHLRPVYNRDNAGAMTKSSFTTIASNVAAWVQEAGMEIVDEMGQEVKRVMWTVLTQYSAYQNGDYFQTSSGKYLWIKKDDVFSGNGLPVNIADHREITCQEMTVT